MKKKPASIDDSKYFKGVRLFRDDIDVIMSTLEDKNYKFQVSDRDFEYTTLDELIENRGDRPSFFQISGEGKEKTFNSVNIYFEKERIRLHSFGQESAKVLFSELRDIFETKYSRIYKWLNPWVYFSASFLISAILWVTFGINPRAVDIPLLRVLVVIFTTAWAISGLYRYNTPQVVLSRRHEGGFWKRNADKIILLAMGAGLGILFNYLIVLLIKAIRAI